MTRTIQINFQTKTPSSYDLGYIGEHNATEITFIPSDELKNDPRTAAYYLAFDTGGHIIPSEVKRINEPFSVTLQQQLTKNHCMSIQLIAVDTEENFIGKTEFLRGFHFKASAKEFNTEPIEDDDVLLAEIHANTAARHTHSNKDLLDTYSQTENDLADAVNKKHTHSNKDFLDTLNQETLDEKVDKIPGKGLSTNDFTDAKKQKLEATNIFFGTCLTAAGTTKKTIITDSQFELREGVTLVVYFSDGCSVAIPVFNVNSTGEHSAYRNSNSTSELAISRISAGGIGVFAYYNGRWYQPNLFNANGTNYGVVSLSDSTNSASDATRGVAATPKAVKMVADIANAKQDPITDLADIRSNAALGATAIQSSQKGAPNGVAELDSTGHIPSEQMPEEISNISSIERIASYLYKITFRDIPEYTGTEVATPACSSFVQNGKLYRNLDWYYDEAPSFLVKCKGFEGIAIDNSLTDTVLDMHKLAQLPYRITDGSNDNGIMCSAHILYNDWDWHGSGNKTVPLSTITYHILTKVQSMDSIESDLADVIANISVNQTLEDSEYLMQFLITDGVTTYALLPPTTSSGTYSLVDITENPKLTNFRWVDSETVERNANYMQDRPTGVERWNAMPCNMRDLRFTECYESPDRLSEFIGINDTDKTATDEELTAIYTLAHDKYLERTRNGELWQTVHSAVYSSNGLEELYVQENWDKNYIGLSESNEYTTKVSLGIAPPAMLVAEYEDGYGWDALYSAYQGGKKLSVEINTEALSELELIDGRIIRAEINELKDDTLHAIVLFRTRVGAISINSAELVFSSDGLITFENYDSLAFRSELEARYMPYDNDQSGLDAQYVQDAIDELAEDIENLEATKYEKSSSGIPKADLASDVQSSLNAADSALQEVPDTYRTAAEQDIIDNEKQDTLSSGTNIKTINNQSILGSGNLDIPAHINGEYILPSADWEPDGTEYTLELSDTSFLANADYDVCPPPSYLNTYGFCGIYAVSQTDGTITFKAKSLPTENIYVYITRRM